MSASDQLTTALSLVRAEALRLNLTRSSEIIEDLIKAVERELLGENPDQKFKAGDFVIISGGMGNVDYGTVQCVYKTRGVIDYKVMVYDYSGRSTSHPAHSSQENMAHATPEEADDFFDQMTMIKMKIWVSLRWTMRGDGCEQKRSSQDMPDT